jgi:hypothetical protein
MSGHTPEPWRVGDPNGDGWENAHEVIAIVDGRRRVLLSANFNFPEQARADALLASAAPDLLKACRMSLDAWTLSAEDYERKYYPFAHPGGLTDKLKAAIAKAEGPA